VVQDFELAAAGQDVPSLGVRDLDPQAPAPDCWEVLDEPDEILELSGTEAVSSS
jgi:hypothetical protein